jgi:hypothetical protein
MIPSGQLPVNATTVCILEELPLPFGHYPLVSEYKKKMKTIYTLDRAAFS